MFIYLITILSFATGLVIYKTFHLEHFELNHKKEPHTTRALSDERIINFVKGVPEDLVHIFDLVCYGFPDLMEVEIKLTFKEITTTMQSRPVGFFSKRRYLLIINSNDDFHGVHFKNIPYNAKIGLIAHEMSHIIDYESKGTFEILLTGLAYLFNSGKQKYEHAIDKLTIQMGFGLYLKAWAQYSMFDANVSSEYKEFKKKIYLSPCKIESLT